MALADFDDDGARSRLDALALAPGLALCLLVTGAAAALQTVELRLFGHAWLESLVLAIMLGAVLRTVWTPDRLWRPGIAVSGRTLLEAAVVLLGASVSARTLLSVGPALLGGIAAVVAVALGLSYVLGRALGLGRRMATLVACGNSICGNSAIAAVAPVIGADGEEIAASIAFTAVLGVAVVVALPFLGVALHLTGVQFGAVAGLTVYAVPQVLAATSPLGSVAVQVGTLVKLVRVLMLGPVCVGLSLVWTGRLRRSGRTSGEAVAAMGRPPSLGRLVPWFILGFLAMIAARSLGLIPAAWLPVVARAASLLTLVSMAALGLGTDLRLIARSGLKVSLAVTMSILGLGLISIALVKVLHLS